MPEARASLLRAFEVAGDTLDLDLQACLVESQVKLMAEYADPSQTEPVFCMAIQLWERLNDTASIARVSFNYAAF